MSQDNNTQMPPHQLSMSARHFLRYLGPGLLITVGFIDPGNWASNMAAGAKYGYVLVWMVTLSTIMLIILQHNAAHLGIVSGDCLSEACARHLPRPLSSFLLGSAVMASAATALAELLGGAIALQMLFHLPILPGAILMALICGTLLLTNSYKKMEKIIIGFVSLIGLSFLFEISITHINWGSAAAGWVTPAFPNGGMLVIMSVLGAVVMPHNLFLHSEIIQSRGVHDQGDKAIEEQLDGEFVDTLLSMGIGWAINSAMIIMAAATFFSAGIQVDDLSQAASTLVPIAGPAASIVFALALLFAGVSSSITAGMAAGTITAGMAGEPYDIRDQHSAWGVIGTFAAAAVAVLFIQDTFAGLVWSQVLLSIQLPLTVFMQIYLTSSKQVMGRYANGRGLKLLLVVIGLVVTGLNVLLLVG